MVFNVLARQAGAGLTRGAVAIAAAQRFAPASLPVVPLARTFAASTSSSSKGSSSAQKPEDPSEQKTASSPTQASQSPSATTEAVNDAAATSVPKRDSTSLFDIDTSESAFAQQMIESAERDEKGGKTGARPKGARSMSSIDKRRKNTSRIVGGLILIATGASVANLGRDWDSEAERERFKDSADANSSFGRIKLRLAAMYEDFNKPAWEQLLPDPLPFPYSRPYTLVVDMDDLLVHSEWSREHGWRTAKRPGLDYFLGYLSQWYEIVLFTTQPAFTAAPIVEKLDPDRRYIAYSLFRESCRSVDGKLVKDLDYLNRDKKKVIILDTKPESFAVQPENGVLIKPWKGEKNDRELIGLVPFFEAIGIYNIDDVRNTIKAYEGKHIPTEHAKRAKEIRDREIEEIKAKNERLGKLGGLFGGIKSGGSGPSPEKTWYEMERERYQQGYAEDLKYWKENGEVLRQQAKEEQERQIKEMKLNAWSVITGQGLKPPGQEGAAQ
ncbi:mitochondrial inner membrane protein required for protein import [Thecaphora frezii]